MTFMQDSWRTVWVSLVKEGKRENIPSRGKKQTEGPEPRKMLVHLRNWKTSKVQLEEWRQSAETWYRNEHLLNHHISQIKPTIRQRAIHMMDWLLLDWLLLDSHCYVTKIEIDICVYYSHNFFVRWVFREIIKPMAAQCYLRLSCSLISQQIFIVLGLGTQRWIG